MAVYRKAPTCPECGEEIRGKYIDQSDVPIMNRIIGDTFQGWDWRNHRCRLGTKYFIERTDTNQWFAGEQQWTRDPMIARMFDTKEKAEEFLKNTNDISARIDAQVTEHEFVRVHPAREPNIKDFISGYKRINI